MDVTAYLRRINYHGPLTPTAETLRRLHVAHLLYVPFENLSIHCGQRIVLAEEALFEKIVTRGRGGFCYELNGLFAGLLRTLRFDVSMLSAGVMRPDGAFGPEFDHMVLLVSVDSPRLVDVGFGDSFRQPLQLNQRTGQPDFGRAYRIDAAGEERFILMQRGAADDWSARYRFSLRPWRYADFEQMCQYHQTSSESPFTRQRTCSLATPNGRITLAGMRLIVTTHGERHERVLADEREYASVLHEHFGISGL